MILLGCVESDIDLGAPGEDAETESVAGLADTGDPPDEEVSLFELDTIHAIDFTWDDEAQQSLEDDGEVDVHADVVVDGELVRDVAVHVKGQIGSERDIRDKAALKVDLNQYVPDQRLHGLEALTLNNMVNDPSYVHERLSYTLFAAAGVPSPRVGYAWVTANGEDFGLYALIETPDDRWLPRWYDDPAGNLYEGGHVGMNGDGTHQHADFTSRSQGWFNLDEGVDVGLADIEAVTASLETEVDWDAWRTFLAVGVWVGDYDGYGWNANNFRVYFDPMTGLVEGLPWGQDGALAYDDLDLPYNAAISGACYADDACTEALIADLLAVCDVADSLDLQGDFETAVTLLADAIEADPRREVSTRDVAQAQATVDGWIGQRSEDVRRRWGR